MNLTIKTLEQVREALDAIGDARDDMGLTFSERNQLELTAVNLRSLERSLIKTQELELIKALADDSQQLKEMVVKIKESAARLAKLSAAVEKASKGVEALISILTTAASAGLL